MNYHGRRYQVAGDSCRGPELDPFAGRYVGVNPARDQYGRRSYRAGDDGAFGHRNDSGALDFTVDPALNPGGSLEA
jgi:hypothetical protein